MLSASSSIVATGLAPKFGFGGGNFGSSGHSEPIFDRLAAAGLVRRGDLAPEFVEGDAVEEGGCLDDQALVEPHEPCVGVLVGHPVKPGTFTIPEDDYGVP